MLSPVPGPNEHSGPEAQLGCRLGSHLAGDIGGPQNLRQEREIQIDARQ